MDAVGTDQGHEHPVDPVRVAHTRARGLSVEDAGRLTSLLSLLADPVRARILHALDEVEELCVGDLALALEATEDSVGYALRLLRTAGMVTTRKAGRVVHYRLADGFPRAAARPLPAPPGRPHPQHHRGGLRWTCSLRPATPSSTRSSSPGR